MNVSYLNLLNLSAALYVILVMTVHFVVHVIVKTAHVALCDCR
jgi:hypothetical protein